MTGAGLLQLRDRLSARDLAVLFDVVRFRLLTSRHIQRLHFAAPNVSSTSAARTCNRSLLRLREFGVLDSLERRVGGVRSGSAGYVWYLGPTGDRLQRALADTPSPRRRYGEPTRHFVEHTLAIAEVAVQVIEASRAARFELLELRPEPGSWQRSLTPQGTAQILKPDLLLATAQGEYEHHWFVEVDRDSEHLPVVLRQCVAYQQYRASGRYQASQGLFPAVVWAAPSSRRAAAIATAIKRTPTLDDRLFTTCLLDEVDDVVAGTIRPSQVSPP